MELISAKQSFRYFEVIMPIFIFPLSQQTSTKGKCLKKCYLFVGGVALSQGGCLKSQNISICILHKRDYLPLKLAYNWMSKKSQSHPSRNIVFTVTTPTQELRSGEYVQKLVQTNTSYQLIPAPLVLNYDTEQIVLAVLPHTKNKLLDITLPFVVNDQASNESCYLGRYLIHNQRLVGVRLASSKREENYPGSDFRKWKAGKATKYKVPKSILDYYKSRKFPQGTFNPEIIIGDFVFSLNEVKICMLFESEFEDSEQTLLECKRQGCEIFSIVCDLPRDHAFESNLSVATGKQPSKNQNLLKRFTKQHNRLILYAGVRMATTKALFLSNSFILHPELPDNIIEPFYFNQGVSLSLLCNLQLMKKNEIIQSKREKFIQTKAKPELYLDTNLSFIRDINPGKSKKYYLSQYKENILPKDNGDLLLRLKAWNFYCQDNLKNPFVMAVPFTDKMQSLAKELSKLSQAIDTPLSSLLLLYKKKSDYKTNSFEENLGATIYKSLDDLLGHYMQDKIYIYTDDNEHYRYLSSIAEKHDRIIIYYNHLTSHERLQNKAKVQRANKLTDFANHIIRNRIIGYQKILKDARSESWNLGKDELIQAISVYLRNKLRTEINHHPFYKSIIQKTPHEVKIALMDAESSIISNDQQIFVLPDGTNTSQGNAADDEGMSVDCQDKQFWVKMKQLKKAQNRQMKRSLYKCHRCSAYYEKQWLYRCPGCRAEMCFICQNNGQQVSQNRSKKQFMETMKCLICQKLCDCITCQKPEDSFNLNNTLTSALMMEVSSNLNILNTGQSNAQFSAESQIQKYREQKQASDYKAWCTVCLINNRKGGSIKIACSTCERDECFQCVKSDSRTKITLYENWQCSVCKPEEKPIIPPEPMVDQKEEPSYKEVSVSKSNEGAPRRQFNNNNNNRGSRNYNNSNFRGNQQRQTNQMVDEREERRQLSNSASPQRATNRNENKNRSPSRSGTPPKRAQPQQKSNNNPAPHARNNSSPDSATPPRNNQKKRSLSNSASPKKAAQAPRDPSRSETPPKNQNNSNNFQNNNQNRNQNQRRGSPSRSGSPVRNPPKNRQPSNSGSPPRQTNQRKRSVSNSGTPPKKQVERKRSVSHSGSPPKQKRKPSASNSRSKSNSRSRSRDRKQPEKLWQQKPRNNNNDREDNYNNNRGDGGSYNNNNRGNYNNNRGGNRDGGNRGRQCHNCHKEGHFARQCPEGNSRGRGGFNNRGGGYNRNQDGNNDRNQGGDRGGFRGRGGRGRGGNFNNNNRDRDDNSNNNSREYNNNSGNNSFNNNSNYRNNSNNAKSNEDENNNNSSFIIPQVQESNFEDY